MIVGLVLGAGSSRRLGQPKQLLEYRGKPLLQAAVDNALAARFDQVIVAVGGAAPEVLETVSFGSAEVVENVAFTTGCSSSIVAALDRVDSEADGLVLLLGDQPGVTVETINACIDQLAGKSDNAQPDNAGLLVCSYENGRGHPFGFPRAVFGELAALQGDKAVWKLLASGRYSVEELSRPGLIPPDVDTWEDYEALLKADA